MKTTNRHPAKQQSLGWNLVALAMLALAAGLLWKATPWAASPVSTDAALTATNTSHEQIPSPTRNIEDVRVGQRVWADNPEVETTAETAVDPATWKLLRLRAETVWDDGTVDDFNVETLQPPEWIELFNAEVGATVPLPLDLVEMGVSEDLRAKVLAIEQCPPIEDGPGRVVLTTVNHLNRFAFELTVVDAAGRPQLTRPTGHHKFYRPTDGQWVSVVDLQAGDSLQDAHGRPVTIQSVEPLPGTHRVYNLTVEGEHVYHVSSLGLLAHNNGCRVRLQPFRASDVLTKGVHADISRDGRKVAEARLGVTNGQLEWFRWGELVKSKQALKDADKAIADMMGDTATMKSARDQVQLAINELELNLRHGTKNQKDFASRNLPKFRETIRLIDEMLELE